MDIRTLRDKTVVVTGAGSGIGKETALAFARRGANLAICDVNEAGLAQTAEQIRALGREALARRVDVANRHEMREFAAAVHERVAAVDILMNNAGVGLGASFLDTQLDDWDWITGINLMGVVYGCHFFLPPMVARKCGGHVINVSAAAAFAATEALCAYSTTKFAVLGLSEALRDELTPHGIGVTAVCPGVINTPITASTRMRGATATEEARRRIIKIYQRRNYGARTGCHQHSQGCAAQPRRGAGVAGSLAHVLFQARLSRPRVPAQPGHGRPHAPRAWRREVRPKQPLAVVAGL